MSKKKKYKRIVYLEYRKDCDYDQMAKTLRELAAKFPDTYFVILPKFLSFGGSVSLE